MAGSSSSSSSSSVTIDGFTYDVFLSFRGLDTRYVFTGSLYKALKDRGIRTFFDKEDIPIGKEITPSLVKAIKESRMAIVVLSPNYATSAFCLKELSHIIHCIRGKGRLVWPIFYGVKPSDVRWLEGTYGEAMAAHEVSSLYNTDTLQKWKDALHEVADLKGTYFKNGGGYQYEFIENIVEQVSRQIKPFTLPVADKLVGLDLRKQDVISLLNVGSNDEVHMVGIHGIGGIGKTTLARCWKLVSIPPLKLSSLEELNLSFCESLESFPPVVDGSMEKLKILKASFCEKLRSIPSLKLPLLEELELSFCESLESFPPVVDGSMEKLKILSVQNCKKLRSILSLKLPLLEELNLSFCNNLESFPEILGVMGNITKLHLVYTGIKKLPNSFRNLARLQRLHVEGARIQLPRSIVTMSELTTLCIRSRGWQFRKEEEDEEKASPMQFSQMKFLYLLNCNLSDESLALGLKWFANVKELDLSGSIFTTLPECIKKCHFLWKLELDYCTELQEIKGIPQSLKTLSAFDCRSLTLSCKNKLLNRELHEDGDTGFLLPEAEIPEWFEHQCKKGSSTFFWFRNKLPAISLCVASQKIWSSRKDGMSKPQVILRINNNENGDITEKRYYPMELCHLDIFRKQLRKYHDNLGKEITYNIWETVEVAFYDPMELCHLHIFHMQMEKLDVNLDRAFSENKWNQVEVVYEYHGILATGIHVLKEKSSMEDIRFTNPENDDVI